MAKDYISVTNRDHEISHEIRPDIVGDASDLHSVFVYLIICGYRLSVSPKAINTYPIRYHITFTLDNPRTQPLVSH